MPESPMTAGAVQSRISVGSFRSDGARIAVSPYRFLGAFRFLLALLVLVSHAAGFLSGELAPLGLGNIGVLLFFVVSGFVICEALDLFYRASSTKFLFNRCLKIFPAYWATLPLAYAVIAVAAPETLRTGFFALFVNATLLTAYLPGAGSLLVVSIAWAVVIEFHFYLVAAAVSFAGRVIGQRAVVTAGAATAALALYLFVWWTGSQARFFGAFQFAPFFILGSFTYFLVIRRDFRALPLLLLAAIFSVHAYYVYSARGDIAPGLWLGANGTRWNVIWSTSLFVALSGLFLYLASGSFRKSLKRVDKHLGDVTYALYLAHMPVILLAYHLDLAGSTGFVFVLVASLLVAVLIQRVIERPVWEIRDILRGRQLYD
jgi:peptidoglycan/LPS O-acetylase OafA/YrhL